MSAKWTKAVFLILLGILLLIYGDGFVTDLETNSAEEWNMSFEWTWDLLRYLIWILIAWLFVDSALIIALSIKADTYTLRDVMDRLAKIEKRLGPEKTRSLADRESDEDEEIITIDENGAPPPPRE
ncbi:MAG TPA: hypothetical protein HA364_04320 [Thermoplasmata archaeon]|nr:hypothetical protein [Thermoplasmata archaeon]